MREIDVDVAIIGAGTAGLGALREVEKAKKSSVLIDAGPLGTTCARVGCMPSKLLVAAADAAHAIEQAPIFGVHSVETWVDGPAVLERVRAERDRFVAGVLRRTDRLPEGRLLKGRARFIGDTTLQVGDDARVAARAVIVATGSRPWIPPPFDALEAHVETSEDVFEWDDLPASVAVVGTGIIGLELGQALARLGVEVAFFNPFDEIGPFTDPKLKEAAKEIFDAELELHVGIEEVAAERIDGGFRISWTEGGERHERAFDRVLAAAGRRPNLEALDLERTGLSLDERGRPEWDPRTCQCGDSPIFLAGDVSGHRPLLHEASDEGHIAGQNAARFPDVEAHVRRTQLAIAFTHPQIAIVGCAHRDLPSDVAIGEVSYANQGRARVQATNAGLVRLYAQPGSCRFLGAEMLGPGVEHMAHLLAWAVQREMTVKDLLSMPFYHPVVEEGLRTGLRNLAKELDVLGECRGEDLPDSPGG